MFRCCFETCRNNLDSFLYEIHIYCVFQKLLSKVWVLFNEMNVFIFWTVNKLYFSYMTSIIFSCLFVVVLDRISVFNHGHPGTHSVYQVTLNKQGSSWFWYYLQYWDWKQMTHVWHTHKKIIFKVQKSKIGTCVFCSQICLMNYFNNLGVNTTYSPAV